MSSIFMFFYRMGNYKNLPQRHGDTEKKKKIKRRSKMQKNFASGF